MADYVSDRADTTLPQADVAAPETTATPQAEAAPQPAEQAEAARPNGPATDTAEARAFVAKRLTRHNAKAAASAVAAAGALLPALAAAALPGGFTPVSEIAGLASWQVRDGRLILRQANGTVREFAAGEWVAGTEPGEIGLRNDLVAVATGGGQAAGGAGNLGVGAAILGAAAAIGAAAAAGGGGGGGGGGAPQPAPTFDVVRSGGEVSFRGTATGDIVATVSGTVTTFTRGGISRTVDGLFSTTGTTGTIMSIAGGQTVILVVTDANGVQTVPRPQDGTVRATGAGNLVIRATDSGTNALTDVSLNVAISLNGGTLTVDMSNDNQDVVKLAGSIDLNGGRLVVSDGVVDAANVALSRIGSFELNSRLIVSLAQLGDLAGTPVLSGVGTLTVAATDGPAEAAILNSVDRKTTLTLDVSAVGRLTGSAADVRAVAESTGIVTSESYAVTVTGASAAAADLNAIDADTSDMVTATAVGTLTGSGADVRAAAESAGITTSESYAVTVTGASAAAADLNAINADTSGMVDATAVGTLTGLMADVLTATTAATSTPPDGITLSGTYAVTLQFALGDETRRALATELNLLDSRTNGLVDATAARRLEGEVAAVKTAILSDGITTATDYAARLTDLSVTVDDANIVNRDTTGVVTARIRETDMAVLNRLDAVDSGAINAYTVTVTRTNATQAWVAATDLNTLDGKTTVPITATAVSELRGLVADVKTAINSDGIATSTIYSAVLTDTSVTVDDANFVNRDTTGVVTATIRETDMLNLGRLDPIDSPPGLINAYRVTVTDASVDAAALNTLDGKTTVTVNALAVRTLTGSARQIAIAISVDTIDTAPDVGVTIAAGEATADDLITIDQNTSAWVDASAVSGVTGTIEDVLFALDSRGLNLTPNVSASVSDTDIDASLLRALDLKTRGTVTLTGVTSISGSFADVNAVLTSTGIARSASTAVNVTVTDTILAAQADTLSELSRIGAGRVTATVVAGRVADLNTTIADAGGQVNILSLQLTNSVLSAADITALNELNGKTDGAIDAGSVQHVSLVWSAP